LKILFVLVGITSLISGFSIYLFFRSDSIIYFNWLNNSFAVEIINEIRQNFTPLKSKLPTWFLFSLPDGLWLNSYMFFIFSIRGTAFNLKNNVWFFSIPILILFHEIGQLFNIFDGTFDIFDLIFYTIGFCIPIAICFFINKKTRGDFRIKKFDF